jgi:hypothetical protein
LSTLSGTHWSPILLPVEPFSFRRTEVRLRLSFADLKSRWEVTATTAGCGSETRSGSPLFTYGWIKPLLAPQTRQ